MAGPGAAPSAVIPERVGAAADDVRATDIEHDCRDPFARMRRDDFTQIAVRIDLHGANA